MIVQHARCKCNQHGEPAKYILTCHVYKYMACQNSILNFNMLDVTTDDMVAYQNDFQHAAFIYRRHGEFKEYFLTCHFTNE